MARWTWAALRPSSGTVMPWAARAGPSSPEPLLDRGGGIGLEGREVDHLAVEAEADRAPEVLLHHPRRRIVERNAGIDVGGGLGDACRDERRERLARAASGWASQMRTSTVPCRRCGRIDHHTCVASTIEPTLMSASRYSRYATQLPKAFGHAAPRERAREREGARGMQVGVPALQQRTAGREREQQRQHGPQAVADLHGAVGALHADVDVQREGVVAAGDVPEAVDDAAVVLGVDVALLAVVGPRMGADRRDRGVVAAQVRDQPFARGALQRDRVCEVVAAPADDLELGRDQLTGDLRSQRRILGIGGVGERLEARHELERGRVEQRELLLQPDRAIDRLREDGLGGIEIE